MKKTAFLFFLIVLIGAGCQPAIPELEEGDWVSSDEKAAQGQWAEKSKRPRIPNSQDFKASLLESVNPREDETQALLETIEKRIEEPNILYEDIERGFYYGGFQEKKLGTPRTWVWVEDGRRSRWVSPNAIEETATQETEELCKKTAGTYVASCVETDQEGCEYIPENTCRCIEGSLWNKKEGCILVDEKGEYISIQENEIARGWYSGLPNQKKLGTPPHWVWVDAGTESRWQNPNPLN